MIVIIPSIREVNPDNIAPLADAGARIVIVDDSGEKSISPWGPRVEVLYYEDRSVMLGDLEACIPKKNGACRDFGLWYAYRHSDPGEVIICLDDDCYVSEDYPGEAVRSIGNQSLPRVEVVSDFFNPVDLFDLGGMEKELFHRGFPYERRYQDAQYQYSGAARGNVVFNFGLWEGAFDINGIDKLHGVDYVHPNVGLKQSRVILPAGVLVPISSMNMIMSREVIPAIYQLPMNESVSDPWKIDRYGDIWGGFICKLLIDKKGDLLSVGKPIIEHRKQISSDGILKNIKQEHFAHLVNMEFCNLVKMACDDVPPSSYLEMYRNFASNLEGMLGRCSSHFRIYMEPTCQKMQMWGEALDA